MKKIHYVFIALALFTALVFAFRQTTKSPLKLYWFIPDGVRAEPALFDIYTWANEGKLPNIKKLMQNGSYGYSYPNFPSHTPTNFAALLTGTYPEINGVNDGPMHILGKPLDKVAIGGFRSVAKKVPPIWKTLEDAGMKVGLLSVPGSTPPEIPKGVVVRGRWGGWGADFHAVNFETRGNLAQRIKQGRAASLFYFGPPLTVYTDSRNVQDWTDVPQSFTKPMEVTLTGWGTDVFAYIYDSTDDNRANYDTIAFSTDKKTVFATLHQGEWSQWQPLTLKWKTENSELPVLSNIKVGLIKLNGPDGFFRIRVFYDNLNKTLTQPDTVAETLEQVLGPMVDFADNFPAQLIYYPEDKQFFQDEAEMSFDWHTGAIAAFVREFAPDAVIHDIYTPNQMLTSRWWMGYVDPKSRHYGDVTDAEREKLWNEVKEMYQKLDTMVGEIIKSAGPDTFIVFSSDHGAVPLDRYVNLNNLFAQKGWLRFTLNPTTGEPVIDWKNSQVIYLKMAHVYINPDGLAGDYKRASGPRYERLRDEVISALKELQDEGGVKPVVDIQKWENVKQYLQLDPDRAGDLVIANSPGYGWNEEMTADLAIFAEPPVTGYKQAIKAVDEPGMWTPFIISGPGIKKNNFLGTAPFPLIDQYPTIMTALKFKIPDFVQGNPLNVFR